SKSRVAWPPVERHAFCQSSRVPVPLPDDPYVAVRQTLLVDTDNELEPEEVSSETDDSQPLGSRVPLMGEEFTAFEPSGTRTVSSHSSDSTAPLSPDHPLTHVLPTPTPTRALYHHRIARMIVRAQPAMSPDHSARVAERYRGTSEIILDTDSEGDELGEEDTKEDESLDTNDEREMSKDVGPGLEGRDEETVPEVREDHVPSTFEVGQRSRSVPEHEGVERVFVFRQPILDTWIEFKDGRVYTDIPAYVPPVAPVQTPPSLEWSSGSLPISPSSLVVLSPIALPVATPIATISVDEDQFLERLDALPPGLFEGIDKDVKELYTRSGAIKDEIFSQRYRFRSLEREQERATMTFSAI
nr:hypothetical protein [Tanacetum cinerariifolium]